MIKARTIVIVWSWTRSGLGEGEWKVAGTSHLEDRVVCLDRPASPAAVETLKEVLTDYSREGGEVMLFLHRHHGYFQDHLKEFLHLPLDDTHGLVRCFLFGEGADEIYLTTNARGLLGTSGTFTANVMFEGQQVSLSAIADSERRELKSTHFDHVWQIYRQALRRRIYELKEDLLGTLSQALPNTVYAPGELYKVLSQPENRMLFLRLLSFVGRIRKRSDLAREIRTFEQRNNRTLTFDDCGIQLETAHGQAAAEQYALLAAYVLRNILAHGGEVSLLELREKFEELLLQISGLTYHS